MERKLSPADASRLVPLMFEMGRLLKRDMIEGKCSLLHIETLRYISEQGRPSMTELGQYLKASKPAVSALVDGLVGDGLVARQEDGADRRRTLLSVSRKGMTTLARAGRRRERAIERLFAPLPGRDQAELARILSFIISHAS
jgi:DNA-binding MarR family transcriptional regulator